MTDLRTRLQKRFWDAHCNGWDEMRSAPDKRALIVAVVDAMAKRLNPGGRVADLGCGPGQHAVALAAAGFEVIAIDYSPAMLERAREHAHDGRVVIDFRSTDLNEALPLPDGALDGALCVSSLQLVDDPARFLAEVRRMLRPDGVVVIESVRYLGALSSGDELRGRDRLLNGAKKLAAKVPGLIKTFDADDIADLLKAAGLQVVATDLYDATFVVTATKP